MDSPSTLDLNTVFFVFLALIGIAMLLALALIVWIVMRIRRIDLSPDADFMTALRATPLTVVVVLDLLDLALDIFSAPISWILLGHLGLAPLRPAALIKDLIPFTNFVPVMTLAWLYARYANQQTIDSAKALLQLRK